LFFSGAAAVLCTNFLLVYAAPLKNIKEGIIRAFFYKQATPTGVWTQKAAEDSVESGHFLSAFCTFHDAYRVLREWARSALVA
jgi:hypothetical protein